MARGLDSLPPQVCPVALGLIGLSGCLGHWARLQGADLAPLPLGCAHLAAALLAAYAAKALLAPDAAARDASDPGTLSALSTGPAALQATAVRLLAPLAPTAAQAAVLACCAASAVIAGRFALLCFRRGARPDPSWFPPAFMAGMTIASASALGPAWLKPLAAQLFWALILIYYPLKAAVAYRMLLSRDRVAVMPNAGMNALMAPASFFTVVHLSSGKPGGDALGLALFADSTAFCLVTLWLLYVRRAAWTAAFHPSYAAFTFPSAATATAAVLAAERLPAAPGQLLWPWAALLTAVAAAANLGVLARLLWHIRGVAVAAPVADADKQK